MKNKEYYDPNNIKAIEICVSKGVNINYLDSCKNYEEYLSDFYNDRKGNKSSFELLTKEEFDLIKKVLLWTN